MFDSLVVEHNGRTLDVQTKRFDCLLYNYRVGDWICGAPPGVVAYFDILRLDADGQRVYGLKRPRSRPTRCWWCSPTASSSTPRSATARWTPRPSRRR
ncbi:MAG: hypothetical protein MZV65_30155 [Chromatiales bacterium]|nr:hypothetical protein [Chromatiales bacterium]